MAMMYLVGFQSNAQLVAEFEVSDSSVCPGTRVFFTDLSTGGATSWAWTFPGGIPTVSAVRNPSVVYTTPGNYTVTLTVGDGSSTDTEVKTSFITVFSGPDADFSFFLPDSCDPLNYSFTNTSSPGSGALSSYLWDFGHPPPDNTSTLANPSHRFPSAGTYTVTLFTTDANGCRDNVSYSITVGDPLNIGFTADTNLSCGADLDVRFSASASGGVSPYSYSWDFGNGNTGTGQNPPPETYSCGLYNVKLVVTDAIGCQDSLTLNDAVRVICPTVGFAISDDTICTNNDLLLSSTSFPPPDVVYWYFDTLTSAVPDARGDSATARYLAPGTYTIRMCAEYGSVCRYCSHQDIVVTAGPTGDFTFSPNPPIACAPPLMVNFDTVGISGTAPFLFEWDLDGVASTIESTASSPSFNYTSAGVYTVRLRITDANGCSFLITRNDLVVIDPPSAAMTVSDATGCRPFTVTAFDLSSSADSIVSWAWDFGDGAGSTFSTSDSATYTYPDTGVYRAKLIITTAGGCVDSVDTVITVREVNVDIDILYAGDTNVDTICPGFRLDVLTSEHDSVRVNWGDGRIILYDSISGPIPYYYGRGDTTFCISVISYLDGCSDFANRCVYVLRDSAIANVRRPCDSLGIFFNLFEDYRDGAWEWDWGDGTRDSNLTDGYHAFPGPGTYLVTLRITGDTLPRCTQLSWPLIVTEVEALYSVNRYLGCGPTRFFFTDLSTDGGVFEGAKEYLWEFGPGLGTGSGFSIDSIPNPNKRFTLPDYYPVRLIVRDTNDCVDTFTDTVVIGNPQIYFSVDSSSGCDSFELRFDPTFNSDFGIDSMRWTFGNPACPDYRDSFPPPCTYAPGTYTISLSIWDTVGCMATYDTLIVLAIPSATFTLPDTQVCYGDSIRFIGAPGGSIVSHYWEFGDGGTSTMRRPYHTYSSSGDYVILYAVEDVRGCVDTLIDTVTIVIDSIDAGFDAISLFPLSCPPSPWLFIDTTNANVISRTWILEGLADTPVAITTTDDSITVFYSESGVFSATLIVQTDEGCIDTASFDSIVYVNGPRGTMRIDTSWGCFPFTVNFVLDSIFADSFFIDFGDSVISAVPSTGISYTYTDTGSFCPRLILIDSLGCRLEIDCPDSIRVGEPPSSGLSSFPNNSCPGDTSFIVNQTAASLINPIDSYYVNFGDGRDTMLDAGFDSVHHIYLDSGAFVIMLVAINDFGCTDTSFDTLIVQEQPVANAGLDILTCPDEMVMLDGSASTGAINYLWIPGRGLSDSTIANPSAMIDSSQTYILRVDNGFCFDFDTLQLIISDSLALVAGPDTGICFGESVTLYYEHRTDLPITFNNWSGSTYLNDSTLINPTSTPASNITYTVSVQCGSLTATDNVDITVYGLPIVNILQDSIRMIEGSPVYVEAETFAGTPGYSYQWSNAGDVSCPTCEDVTISADESGWYRITVTDANGCQAVDSVYIWVLGPCSEEIIEIGKAFTPNGDGNNDRFYFRSYGIDVIDFVRVYNRWGELVWESNRKEEGWDGKHNGEMCNPDVFMYHIMGTCINNEPVNITGSITLLR